MRCLSPGEWGTPFQLQLQFHRIRPCANSTSQICMYRTCAPLGRNASQTKPVVSKAKCKRGESLGPFLRLPPEKLKPREMLPPDWWQSFTRSPLALRLFLVHPFDLAGRPASAAISWNAWYEALVT